MRAALHLADNGRDNPWRTLGETMPEGVTLDEALELVDVHDEVIQTKPIYTLNDNAATWTDPVSGEAWVRAKDMEHIPADVGVAVHSSKFQTMATAGRTWHGIERRDLLSIAFDIVGLAGQEDKRGYIDAIGNMGVRGDLFFAYIKVPDIVVDPGGVHDVIEHGLYVATSYSGKIANTLGYSSIRPACTNVVMMALGNLNQTIRARHTRNSEARIRQAAVALQYAGAVEAEMIQRAERMLKVPGDDALVKVLDHFYDVKEEGLGDRAITQRKRARAAIRRLYEGEGNTTTDLVGYNGWAAFQAFIEFKDHEADAKGNSATRSLTRARNSVLPGRVANEKVTASDLILALGA